MSAWLTEALRVAGLQSPTSFPRNLKSDAQMYLPVSVVELKPLKAAAVQGWLNVRGLDYPIAKADRELHGCLVVHRGYGLVFLDARDELTERRFTLAHEVAHFILEYLVPRECALKKYGSPILPVIDGERSASTAERLASVIERVPIGVRVHLMTRSSSGAVCGWEILEGEERADRLALELLAPLKVVVAEVKRKVGARLEGEHHDDATAILTTHFGLPESPARAYAVHLLTPRRTKGRHSDGLFVG